MELKLLHLFVNWERENISGFADFGAAAGRCTVMAFIPDP